MLLRWAETKTADGGSNKDEIQKNQLSTIDNCLCLFTNRSIFVFKVVFPELYEMNKDFNKCLAKEHLIEINQIEIIELSIVQNYLILEVVAKENGDQKMFFKFVTFDVYQTQTILNSLLSEFI